MAPKKRRNDIGSSSTAATTRVTRSSSLLAKTTNPPAAAEPEPPKKKKAKTTTSTEKKAKAPPVPPQPAEQEPEPPVLEGSKTIVIEHCKQCNSFKTRAIQVKNGLEKGLEGVNVVVNPEKPRRGCFEIREEGGEIFVSLLDMKRPFAPMKALDMEKVISDIIEKIE
ncbi:selenoprotein H-like [Forsythia ovata]|uniref:Selenoprotein H-like n=1 Tax=Forsythia ovata TaxID=205694 RepID=A0ABD1W3G6_9LAMI